MKPLDTLLEELREHGLKVTPQRRAILELLVNDDSHPTAEQVYQRVLATMPDVSRTTVYNTLRELKDLGELASVYGAGEGGQRYDTNQEPHHHLCCVECRRLVDIDRDFTGMNLSDEEAAGYRIVSHQVVFFGICPDCRAREKPQITQG